MNKLGVCTPVGILHQPQGLSKKIQCCYSGVPMKCSITYLLLAACALLAGCGSEGPPQAPSLGLPQPGQDLRASRKGTKVTVDWTQPSQTTDREAAGRHLGETVICQGISDAPGQALSGCPQEINRVSPKTAASSSGKSSNPASAPAEVSFNLPGELLKSHPLTFAEYAVMVNNHSERNAGMSNSAAEPLAPTLPPPSDLKAEVRADGVYLSASPASEPLPDDEGRLQLLYRIDRVDADSQPPKPGTPPAAPVKVAELPASGRLEAADRAFEWEKNYVYSATPETRILSAPEGGPGSRADGETSRVLPASTHDTLLPAPRDR